MSALSKRGNLKDRKAAGRIITLLSKAERPATKIREHCSLTSSQWKRCRDILLDFKLIVRTGYKSSSPIYTITEHCRNSLAQGGRTDDLIGLADASHGSALWASVNNLDDRLSIIEAILADDMGDPVWVNLLHAAQTFLEDMSDENLAELEEAVEDVLPSSSRPSE